MLFSSSDVARELLAAKKERALYATKLLIEAPLMGLCALAVWTHWTENARASGVPANIYAVLRDMLESDVPVYYYAVTLGVMAGYMLCSRFLEDIGDLALAAWKCKLLREDLP